MARIKIILTYYVLNYCTKLLFSPDSIRQNLSNNIIKIIRIL